MYICKVCGFKSTTPRFFRIGFGDNVVCNKCNQTGPLMEPPVGVMEEREKINDLFKKTYKS